MGTRKDGKMVRKLFKDESILEVIIPIGFLVLVFLGSLLYNQIVYGDAGCLFKQCVVEKEEHE